MEVLNPNCTGKDHMFEPEVSHFNAIEESISFCLIELAQSPLSARYQSWLDLKPSKNPTKDRSMLSSLVMRTTYTAAVRSSEFVSV